MKRTSLLFFLFALMVYAVVPVSCGQRQLTEKDMAGYLMVYFLEHGHNVYFAVSRDG